MKIEFDEHELVWQIANEIIKQWDDLMRNDCIKYTDIGKLLKSEIDKIIADNKEKIITDATKLCADRVQEDINLRAVFALLAKKE